MRLFSKLKNIKLFKKCLFKLLKKQILKSITLLENIDLNQNTISKLSYFIEEEIQSNTLKYLELEKIIIEGHFVNHHKIFKEFKTLFENSVNGEL